MSLQIGDPGGSANKTLFQTARAVKAFLRTEDPDSTRLGPQTLVRWFVLLRSFILLGEGAGESRSSLGIVGIRTLYLFSTARGVLRTVNNPHAGRGRRLAPGRPGTGQLELSHDPACVSDSQGPRGERGAPAGRGELARASTAFTMSCTRASTTLTPFCQVARVGSPKTPEGE